MLPRSAAGRKIVTEVEAGGKVYIEPQKEKLVFLKKRTKDQLLGFRFGLHPESRQVIVTELYSGYAAQQSGKIFVGDVLSQVNGIRVTEVDMATQLIKMAEGNVEFRFTNVFNLPKSVKQSKPPERPPPAAAPPQDLLLETAPPPAPAAAAAPPPELDLLGWEETPTPAAAPLSKKVDSLLDDLVLDDDDFSTFTNPSSVALSPTPQPQPAGNSLQAQIQGLYAQQQQQHPPQMYGYPPQMHPSMRPYPPAQMAPNLAPPPGANSQDPWASGFSNFPR